MGGGELAKVEEVSGEETSADERWQMLADHVHANGDGGGAAARSAMLQPLGEGSWRVDVLSIGVNRPRTRRGKLELIVRQPAIELALFVTSVLTPELDRRRNSTGCCGGSLAR